MISVVLHATRLSRQMSLTTAMISRQPFFKTIIIVFLSGFVRMNRVTSFQNYRDQKQYSKNCRTQN